MASNFTLRPGVAAIVFATVFILSSILQPDMQGLVKSALNGCLCVAFYALCFNLIRINGKFRWGKFIAAFLGSYIVLIALYSIIACERHCPETFVTPLFILIPLYAGMVRKEKE